jgi:Uma2 family endonuclease
MITPDDIDEDILYSDNEVTSLADNTKHFRWLVMIKENLEILFANHEDVFIAGDLLWYPDAEPLMASTAPDVMVVFGRPKGDRKSYRQWQENDIPPTVVFEILSQNTTDIELWRRLRLYQGCKVEEYYTYDPETYVLEGLIRDQNQVAEIAEVNGWVSPRLGIKFDTSQGELVIYRPDGKRFLTSVQLYAELELERQRAEKLAAYVRSLGIDPDNLPTS